MANSVDPDEMVCYKPSHQDQHCLHRYLFWIAGRDKWIWQNCSFLTSMKLDGHIAFGHGVLQTHLLSAIFYKGNNFCDLIFAFQILNPF